MVGQRAPPGNIASNGLSGAHPLDAELPWVPLASWDAKDTELDMTPNRIWSGGSLVDVSETRFDVAWTVAFMKHLAL